MSSKTTGNFLMRNLISNQAQDSSRCYSNCASQQQLARCQLLLSDFLNIQLSELKQNLLNEPANRSIVTTISNVNNCQQLSALTSPDASHRASINCELSQWTTSSSPPSEVIDLSVRKRCCHDQAHYDPLEGTRGDGSQQIGCKSPGAEIVSASRAISVPSNSDNEARTRRTRTMFSEWQLSELEWRFDRNKYLITRDRHRIAKLLELDQLQVKTWFQNRRMKWKKQILASGLGVKSPTKPKGRPKRDSIPPIDDD